MDHDERQRRDKAVLDAIGTIYCSKHHSDAPRAGSSSMCPDCTRVMDYALTRAGKCPNGHTGNCQDCSIHCYEAGMRDKMRVIMRYSAPRMLYKHPVMTAHYVAKKLKDNK